MSAIETQVLSLPVSGHHTIDDARPVPTDRPVNDAAPDAKLLYRIAFGEAQPREFRDIEARLAGETSPHEIWKLLCLVDVAPRDAVDLEKVYLALMLLVDADSVFLRSAAYRWLAGLHRKNLCYEMRAKRVLKRGLKRETGLARKRVEALLKRC